MKRVLLALMLASLPWGPVARHGCDTYDCRTGEQVCVMVTRSEQPNLFNAVPMSLTALGIFFLLRRKPALAKT